MDSWEGIPELLGRIGDPSPAVKETVFRVLGQILERLPVEELRQPWVMRAAACLCDLLEQAEHVPLECGALYHAIHGLDVYRKRAFSS